MRTLQMILVVSLLFWGQAVLAQLKVKPDGFVGIGTNDPVVRLHVYGDGLIDSYAGGDGSAFSTRIHYKSTNAYNLRNEYYGRDVFFVSGEGWSWSLQGRYVGADSSRMRDISPIISPLISVMQLEGLRYRYRDEKAGDQVGPYRLGLIAQDVEKVEPEAVRLMRDSTKAVSYDDLVPLLIEAMKEQQEQIESLQAALNVQSEEIDRIKNRRWFRRRTVE